MVVVVVVGVTVVVIIVVIGPDGTSIWYARILLLSCMSCTCILFVCLAIRTNSPETSKKVVSGP